MFSNVQSDADLFFDSFDPLTACNEIILQPDSRMRRRWNFDGEIIVSVHKGIVRCVDPMGASEVLRAGEIRMSSVRMGDQWTHKNDSRTQEAHVFEIGWNSARSSFESSTEQKRFTAAQRRGTLCVVASTDGRQGSLRLAANVRLYSAMLLPGQHIVHELTLARRAWLQVVEGALTVGGVTVVMGEGIGVTNEPVLSIRADVKSELLLVDLG